MISFEEAYELVMDSCVETGTETVQFTESRGRILAEDIFSDIDMPPFNRAAVDGYACNREDIGRELEIVEMIQAGQVPEKTVGKGQCTKIMTGAIVPDGCDMVFMVEDSKETSPGRVIFAGRSSKSNLSLRGEDVKTGAMVLARGKIIMPQDIAVMASVGHTKVVVSRKP